MARACTCCSHPDVAAMRAAWIAGSSARAIAAGRNIDFRAVHRCMKSHLPALLAGASSAPIAPQLVQPVATIEPNAPSVPHVPRAWQLDDTPAGDTEPQGSPSTSVSIPTVLLQPAHAPAAPSPGPAGPVDIWAAVHALHARGLAVLNRAEIGGDDKLTLAALRELRGVVETLARLAPAHGTTTATTPYAQTTEWGQLRAAILDALADYPDARLAVAEALTSSGALS